MVMRLATRDARTAGFIRLLVVIFLSLPGEVLLAADKAAVTLFVKDALTVPGRSTTIEARLSTAGPWTTAGVGGEPIELLVEDKVVATGMTGGDGRVFLSYRSNTQGILPIRVRVGKSSRVSPVEGWANLVVWEQRNPIVAVELAALIEQPPPPPPVPLIGAVLDPGWKPMLNAAEQLAKLTQFYYRVIYVVALPSSGADGFRVANQAREWLKAHQFPLGYVLVLPPGGDALGEKLDTLRAEGWKTVKIGIGRTRGFVEAFLNRRLQAVMVPEPAGEAPPKVRVAKDWKEVRKKL
ncbi:MAG: hypothetical protein NNA20_00740 [Nitrospira sp.]|nr:hypothetical protein [Nitrospira sp.]MCP9441095.1 hypothetical protein [Nitrospira sp.]